MQFPVGRVFEDMWTIPQLLSQDVRVQTTSLGPYLYYWNKDSITVKDVNILAKTFIAESSVTNSEPRH